MSDDELRALLRTRDASPGDLGVARRAAALASRLGGRDVAAEAWQEVLRRSPRDREAEDRLRGLGCELLYRSTALGIERFESTLDRAILARTPALPGLFVGERPVSNEEFLRFLEDTGARGDQAWVRTAGVSPFTFQGGSWSLRGTRGDSPVRFATWPSAAAFARWAHGRLLEIEEWAKLLVLRAYGWNLLDEWTAATRTSARGAVEHAIATPAGHRWVGERARYEGPAFRYARESWFA